MIIESCHWIVGIIFNHKQIFPKSISRQALSLLQWLELSLQTGVKESQLLQTATLQGQLGVPLASRGLGAKPRGGHSATCGFVYFVWDDPNVHDRNGHLKIFDVLVNSGHSWSFYVILLTWHVSFHALLSHGQRSLWYTLSDLNRWKILRLEMSLRNQRSLCPDGIRDLQRMVREYLGMCVSWEGCVLTYKDVAMYILRWC